MMYVVNFNCSERNTVFGDYLHVYCNVCAEVLASCDT